MAEPNHADLYKQSLPSQAESVSRRRDCLLAQQKLQRQTSADGQRNIQDILQELAEAPPQHNRRRNQRSNLPKYKNKLQLSEWLTERPDDFENWFLVGCPKGNRCMVVATAGKTIVYGKNGGFIRKLRTLLPGDAGNQSEITILDCVFVKETNEYWVLDALAYGKLDLTNCDVSFRFFWIAGLIYGDGLEEIQRNHEASFKCVRFADCSDMEAIDSMLSTYPMYENNSPEVDGLLFYHKESSYVHGKTPLVGWLYPFMVPEVLGIGSVSSSFMAMRPDDYVDSGTYIKQFNASLKKRSPRKYDPCMEVEQDELLETYSLNNDSCLEGMDENVEDIHSKIIDDEEFQLPESKSCTNL